MAELIAKGDKRLKKFFSFGTEKYDDARELYYQAANQFKKVQDWEGAEGAFLKCLEMDKKLKCDSDQIQDLTDAGTCAKKYNYKKAADYWEQAIEKLVATGRHDRAAKLSTDCAKLFEEQLLAGVSDPEGTRQQILEWWEKTLDLYKLNRNSTVHCNDCILKIAEIRILQGSYSEACEMFEDLGKQYADDNLLRFNARGQFFVALLCQLAQIVSPRDEAGIDRLRSKFDQYREIDVQFAEETHEFEFITSAIKAFEDADLTLYTEATRKYDRICPLDKTKEILVLKGRAALKVEDFR
eukprot:TRINITY_DN4131_c0_g1_i1.p1 TRINITY_DN4131_c0_g1~~TRINITY_DN4131_c0_g1_i1.p1  ORF type:complete len:297 (+),score=64.81 TRINITY_DN4131_c0_g1_i1:45-935(+)